MICNEMDTIEFHLFMIERHIESLLLCLCNNEMDLTCTHPLLLLVTKCTRSIEHLDTCSYISLNWENRRK